MRKVLGSLVLAGILTASVSYAGNITVANSTLELSGGLYAGFVATDNDVVNEKDNFHVTTADLKLINKIDGKIGFVIDMGRTYQKSLISTDLAEERRTFDIEIAYISLKALDNLIIDAGLLPTNVGNELFHPNENGNILFGMLWNGQPVTYNGVRATFEASESLSLYAEYLQEDRGGGYYKDGYAVGVLGTLKLGRNAPEISYALSFFDYAAERNIVDLVINTTIGSVDFGLNFDYQYLDDTAKEELKAAGATNIEDSAYGIAVYLTPHLTNSIYVPIRFEYINDKDSTDAAGNVISSGIYGVGGDSAYSISVTPTWKPSKHSFVRAEFDYVKTDKVSEDIFGQNEDSRTVYAIEAGYSF